MAASEKEPWEDLRDALVDLVRRSVERLHDVEDLASEVVFHALKRFGLVAPWQDLVSWSLRVVRRLIAKFYRTAARSRAVTYSELDDFFAPPGLQPLAAVEGNDFAERLWARLQPTERATLSHLVTGATNEEIAKARRVSIRSVQKSRAKLSQAANDLRR